MYIMLKMAFNFILFTHFLNAECNYFLFPMMILCHILSMFFPLALLLWNCSRCSSSERKMQKTNPQISWLCCSLKLWTKYLSNVLPITQMVQKSNTAWAQTVQFPAQDKWCVFSILPMVSNLNLLLSTPLESNLITSSKCSQKVLDL